MQSIQKGTAKTRLEDAFEFLESAKGNLNEKRFKASIDHSIASCIAANDAFTISHLEKIANISHYEALDLHRDAAKKFRENKVHILRLLLNERHRITYRPIKTNEHEAKSNLKRAIDFVTWIKEHV